MRNFYIDKIQYSCPRGFDECTAEQVGFVVAYQTALQVFGSAAERTNLKIRLLCELTSLPKEILNKLTATQQQRLLNCIAWCKNAKIPEKRLFESFEFGGVRYYLPSEGMADTSAIELAMCTIYEVSFAKEIQPNTKAIFSIIATICRPQRADIDAFRKSSEWNGDVREEYNSVVAEQRAVEFEQLSFGICKAVYAYWSGMLAKFWKRYEALLGETDEEPLYQNGEGQITMLMDVAEIGVFGDFDKVCKQNVHTIFINLRDKKLKADRMALQHQQNTEDE